MGKANEFLFGSPKGEHSRFSSPDSFSETSPKIGGIEILGAKIWRSVYGWTELVSVLTFFGGSVTA